MLSAKRKLAIGMALLMAVNGVKECEVCNDSKTCDTGNNLVCKVSESVPTVKRCVKSTDAGKVDKTCGTVDMCGICKPSANPETDPRGNCYSFGDLKCIKSVKDDTTSLCAKQDADVDTVCYAQNCESCPKAGTKGSPIACKNKYANPVPDSKDLFCQSSTKTKTLVCAKKNQADTCTLAPTPATPAPTSDGIMMKPIFMAIFMMAVYIGLN